MIPRAITDYLDHHNVRYTSHAHPRAVAGQALAATVHVSGFRVAKAVLVEADGRPMIAVVPAAELLDETKLCSVTGAKQAGLLRESSFGPLFPGCEVGAEPPFGRLYSLPVVLDTTLASGGPILFRAGSHEETIEVDAGDYIRLEQPRVAPIAQLRPLAQPRIEEKPESYYF